MSSRGSGRRRRSLRARVLAAVLGVTVVVLAAFDAVAVVELRRYLMTQQDASLQAVLNLTEARLPRLLARVQSTRRPVQLEQTLASYYVAFVADGGPTAIIEGSPQLVPVMPGHLTILAQRRASLTVAPAHGPSRLRLRAQPADGGTLLATASLHDLDQTVAQLRLIVIAGSAAAVVVIALGAAVALRRGLRPLETMAAQADRISAGDLTPRVGPDDDSEVGRLGQALNGMLGRIEGFVSAREEDQEAVRRFFADASHELRTPLASLRANAELYQQGALRQRAQVDEAMRRIGLEAQRMSGLVDDMLRLARLDQHPEPRHQRVDVSAVVEGCAQRAQVAQPARPWQCRVEPGLAVMGDEELLRRAVDNLLVNVGAHTPADAPAAIEAKGKDGSIVIEVRDTGPGVPPDRLPRIFDRFYRAGPPSDRPGAGLGLAIVAEVAAAHGGRVGAALEPSHGLRVTLTLPAVDITNPSLQR
ncbi:MAG TPA: HAMP domain-containing sensor histidine kinase [Acidimicrobiales bacterium]|nr:HAMP domain-containing sensor histidine kinase [Acidimicrobiales bacterium]